MMKTSGELLTAILMLREAREETEKIINQLNKNLADIRKDYIDAVRGIEFEFGLPSEELVDSNFVEQKLTEQLLNALLNENKSELQDRKLIFGSKVTEPKDTSLRLDF